MAFSEMQSSLNLLFRGHRLNDREGKLIRSRCLPKVHLLPFPTISHNFPFLVWHENQVFWLIEKVMIIQSKTCQIERHLKPKRNPLHNVVLTSDVSRRI